MLGKLENGQLKIASGKKIEHDGVITVNPKEKDFIDIGYKPVEDRRLPDKEGYYQVPEYVESGDVIIATYHYEELPNEESAT